jgi:hypothetical protein
VLALAERAHRALAAAVAELLDLGGAQAVREAPAVGGSAVGVDDVGERDGSLSPGPSWGQRTRTDALTRQTGAAKTLEAAVLTPAPP